LKKINISIKKNKIERKRNEKASLRTAKGATHDKGSFAVQDSMSHSKVPGHDNTVRRCRGSFLYRAFRHAFAVRVCFAVLCCGLARQSSFCRAEMYVRVLIHGN
jgi:hypothetical protein